MTDRAVLAHTFLSAAGWADATRSHLAGDASNRRYERLTNADNRAAVLMDADPATGEDVQPFIRITHFLREQGLSAPNIYAADPQNGFLLIEDLGDDLFARLMSKSDRMQLPLYRAATEVLIHLHQTDAPDLPLCDADWLCTATAPAFEWYAQDAAQDSEQAFLTLFHPLAQQLDETPKVAILRDFHAENLLWLPERVNVARVGLLDYQDALLGHPAYDLVSILQDARRDVPPDIEEEMIQFYITRTGTDHEAFRFAYALLGAQRNLRILGIFARLSLRDGKTQYVDLIPRVWNYLSRNLANPLLADSAKVLTASLPAPTPAFLEYLRSQCRTAP